jgi:hypothetical protein
VGRLKPALRTSFFDRAGRIAGPFRPRTREQARAVKSCVLHREQILAGGHSRSAIHDDLCGVVSLQHLVEVLAKRLGRSSVPSSLRLVLKK